MLINSLWLFCYAPPLRMEKKQGAHLLFLLFWNCFYLRVLWTLFYFILFYFFFFAMRNNTKPLRRGNYLWTASECSSSWLSSFFFYIKKWNKKMILQLDWTCGRTDPQKETTNRSTIIYKERRCANNKKQDFRHVLFTITKTNIVWLDLLASLCIYTTSDLVIVTCYHDCLRK